MAPVGSLEEWAGLAGKPITHIEQACAGGYIAFTEAVNSVASGQYDIVLVAGERGVGKTGIVKMIIWTIIILAILVILYLKDPN